MIKQTHSPVHDETDTMISKQERRRRSGIDTMKHRTLYIFDGHSLAIKFLLFLVINCDDLFLISQTI